MVGALSSANPSTGNTLPGEMKVVKQLASDKDIVILPDDKGRATVAMNRSEYSVALHS